MFTWLLYVQNKSHHIAISRHLCFPSEQTNIFGEQPPLASRGQRLIYISYNLLLITSFRALLMPQLFPTEDVKLLDNLEGVLEIPPALWADVV